MLPTFPLSKRIEVSDGADVHRFTKSFPPYSDFDFASLWSWDVTNAMRISQLHGNLVVQFTDYLTEEQFLSFLGGESPGESPNETAQLLLNFSKEKGLSEQLRLMPEESIRELDRKKFIVNEDKNNFDYVYDVGSLSKMEGSKLAEKRKHSRHFQRQFSQATTTRLDLTEQKTRQELMQLFKNWSFGKGEKTPLKYFEKEFRAFSRFLNASSITNVLCLGIHIDTQLIAASIVEISEANDYALSHFQKALTAQYKGVNDFLTIETAKQLEHMGLRFLNVEQDLGLPGLQESKMSYRPHHFLKKYCLSSPTV